MSDVPPLPDKPPLPDESPLSELPLPDECPLPKLPVSIVTIFCSVTSLQRHDAARATAIKVQMIALGMMMMQASVVVAWNRGQRTALMKGAQPGTDLARSMMMMMMMMMMMSVPAARLRIGSTARVMEPNRMTPKPARRKIAPIGSPGSANLCDRGSSIGSDVINSVVRIDIGNGHLQRISATTRRTAEHTPQQKGPTDHDGYQQQQQQQQQQC
jgi:hypothetical protein